jgi:hypothetical protein
MHFDFLENDEQHYIEARRTFEKEQEFYQAEQELQGCH